MELFIIGNYIIQLFRFANPIIMFVMTFIMIVLTEFIGVVAVISIIIANKSYREAEKARRDTFLPIVLITQLHQSSGTGSHVKGEISSMNHGHSTAFNVKAHIPGTGTIAIATKELAAGSSPPRVVYDLPNANILENKVITLIYGDIFGRQIKTLHEVNVAPRYDNGRHQLQLKNVPPVIILP